MSNLPKITFKKIVQAIKSPTFIGFSLVSAALSLYLDWMSGTEQIERILLGVTAFSLEGLKLYALLTANIYMDYIKLLAKEKQLKFFSLLRMDIVAKGAYKAALGLYAVYTLAAAISVFGSYNFTLATIDKTVRLNEASMSSTLSPEEVRLISETAFYEKEIKRLEERIVANTADYMSFGPEFMSAKDRVQKKIDADAALQFKYETEKSTREVQLAVLQAGTKASSADIKKTSFQIMAENLSNDKRTVTAQQILGWLLLLTSLMIELGIIVTSPHEDTFGIFEKVARKNPTPEEPPPEPPKPTKKKYKKKEKILETALEEGSGKAFKDYIDTSIKEKAKEASQVIHRDIFQEALDVTDQVAINIIKEPARIEVHPSPLYDFLKDILPENGQPGFLRKENINNSPYLDPLKAKELFNNLTRAKGHTGYAIFEFRKDHKKWYSNYSLADITSILSSAT